jgi:hypothetical protein
MDGRGTNELSRNWLVYVGFKHIAASKILFMNKLKAD